MSRPATWAIYQRGLKVTGVEYVEAIAAVHAAGRKLAAFLQRYDVILSTVLAGPPPKLGYFDQNGDAATFAERVNPYLSVTPLHNATGTPAMSVPLHWTADGLPVGVHFAGRYGEEATLLRPRRPAGAGAALVRPAAADVTPRRYVPPFRRQRRNGLDLEESTGAGQRRHADGRAGGRVRLVEVAVTHLPERRHVAFDIDEVVVDPHDDARSPRRRR